MTTENTSTERPLEGLRVIDLTRALAGPYATLLLAGLGAEVIKIEDPCGGDLARENSPYVGRNGVVVERKHEDDVSISHLTRARGKHGISLDLKKPEAKQIFRDLVKTADIVVENFTSGTADRLGVGYQVSKEENPGIIYCSLSGFGATSSGGKAMDIIIQALSGAMYASGVANEAPVRVGFPIADMLAPVFSVIGILAALEQRHRTGEGQHIDVSMLGALTSFVSIENWAAMEAAGMETRSGLTVPRLSPFGVFECADGYIALVAVHEKLAEGLFNAMEQPELIKDPRFSTRDVRVANAKILEETITEWTRTLSTADVVAKLEYEGVPVAPVRHPQEAMKDDRVVERKETEKVVHPKYDSELDLRTAGIPIQFSGAKTGFDDVLPVTVGEHNDSVLADKLGYSAQKIAQLRSKGII